MRTNPLNDTLGFLISSCKVVCGFMLIRLFSTTPRFLFLFSGLFLMMTGLRFLVYYIFDEINDWNVRRLDKKERKH